MHLSLSIYDCLSVSLSRLQFPPNKTIFNQYMCTEYQ